MMWIANCEKRLMMLFSRFNTIPACYSQKDRQTDGETDILRQHSPRYALHRAVKMGSGRGICERQSGVYQGIRTFLGT